jgi:hypothetical protein
LGDSSGSSGSITSQSSSVTSFLAIPSAYPSPGFVRRCKALAQFRKMGPAVQINIAEKQINTAG